MQRKEFETWLKKNNLETVHTGNRDVENNADYKYTSWVRYEETYDIIHRYGVFQCSDKSWKIASAMMDDRGPVPCLSFYGTGFRTEEEALDALKRQIEFYAPRTYAYTCKKSIEAFTAEIMFKKIQQPNTEGIDSQEYDISFNDYMFLINKYFSKDFYASANYGNLKVYSSKYHTLMFEIESKNFHEKSYFIPIIVKYDRNRYLGKVSEENILNSTFKEVQTLYDNALYILYYNSLVAFEKYDYSGKLIYRVNWNADYDLRTYGGKMNFIHTDFVTSDKFDDKEYISITNGLNHAVFDRETGRQIQLGE